MGRRIAAVDPALCDPCVTGPGSGHIGQGHNIQGTLCSRGATSKNFRSGTHRSSTHQPCIGWYWLDCFFSMTFPSLSSYFSCYSIIFPWYNLSTLHNQNEGKVSCVFPLLMFKTQICMGIFYFLDCNSS